MASDEQGQEEIAHRTDKSKKIDCRYNRSNMKNLIDSAQLYKKGNMKNKEFLFKLGEYMKSMSSINFLSTQIVLELKSVFEENKGPSRGESLSRLNSHTSRQRGNTQCIRAQVQTGNNNVRKPT